MKYFVHSTLGTTALEDRKKNQAQEGQFELNHKCSFLYEVEPQRLDCISYKPWS